MGKKLSADVHYLKRSAHSIVKNSQHFLHFNTRVALKYILLIGNDLHTKHLMSFTNFFFHFISEQMNQSK